ncbi:MAG: hypothetical protein WBM24_23945 [Candidatus Sulfotelmatobacter sp.]
MVANALLVAVAILLGYLFWLMGELKFLGKRRSEAVLTGAVDYAA